MIAAKIVTMRQGARTDLEPRTNSSEVTSAGKEAVLIPMPDAAATLRVGTSIVKDARAVLAAGAPELIHAVETGVVGQFEMAGSKRPH